MLRLHIPLIEPDVRISRIRLSDQVLPQGLRDRAVSTLAGLTRPIVSYRCLAGNRHSPRDPTLCLCTFAWPSGIAFVAAPGFLRVLLDPWSITFIPCRFVRILEPGLLPSTGVNRLHRYYEPLRHPSVAERQMRPVAEPINHDRWASRVARCSLLACCHPLPRRSGPDMSSNTASGPWQPSPSPGRVGLRIVSFGAVSVFTRVTACQLADGLAPPCVSQASAI